MPRNKKTANVGGVYTIPNFVLSEKKRGVKGDFFCGGEGIITICQNACIKKHGESRRRGSIPEINSERLLPHL
jgi:hypothetical protein